MDKSWALLDNRRLEAYRQGCLDFLEFAFRRAIDGHIRCPCKDCRNKKTGDYDTVHYHLLMRGIQKEYGTGVWLFHSETEANVAENVRVPGPVEDYDIAENINVGENMNDLLRACYPTQSNQSGNPIPESDNFRKLIEEANTPLYADCKDYTSLEFVIELYQIKSRGKMSDKTFSETLQLLKKAFPFIKIPDSFYETKKLIGKLGCGYVKIDACENDCILFWKDDKDLNECRVCHASRWKRAGQVSRKRIPKKVLRHFPLIPRLQRLYMTKKSAVDMKWHAEKRYDDGRLRHPADSDAWKEFDKKHQLFASETRNIRLGLASDGFNPFGSLSSQYSTWPVVLMVYNLPPGMCTQQSNMILSLLIFGPKGPKNNIDVYLQPLVDELKELWGPGVRTTDSSTSEKFDMRAALMWTVNDFPAFANLSGWSTVGFLACPSCGEGTVSERLFKSNKQCYMGHSRFTADGAPPPPTGDEVLFATKDLDVTFGVGQPAVTDS